jgi:hypothetical protein
MAGKTSKTKRQIKNAQAEREVKQRAKSAQIFFAIFAAVLILSMILAAVSKF